MNECEVYFCLRGRNFDPSIVKRTIDLEGAIIKPRSDPLPKFSSWIFSTGNKKGDCIDVYHMAADLVSKLEPHRTHIAELKKKLGLEAILEIVLTISKSETLSTPALGFDRTVLDFLSATDATIDIDTYLT